MAEQIFIRLRGRIQGPFSADQLQSMSRKGQFSRMHEVSNDGIAWARASLSPELFPAIRDPNSATTVPPSADTAPPIGPSATVAPPPTNVWYYCQFGSTNGPVDLSHLRQMVESGLLVGEDMVWKEGMPEWIHAASVPGLVKPAGYTLPQNSGQHCGQSTEPPRVSALAVSSLVLGLLWLFGIGSLLAIIFGGVAIHQINISRGQLTGKGLAVAGLVLGIVFMALQVIGMVMNVNQPGLVHLR
jgi:GYF domain 2/Domain of unknown function (DUF4190)